MRSTDPEYATLLNAKMPSGRRDALVGIVKIRCEAGEAYGLLTLARRFHCDAVTEIEKSMSLPPKRLVRSVQV